MLIVAIRPDANASPPSPAGSAASEWRYTAQAPSGGLAQDPQSGGHGSDAQGGAREQHAKSFQEQQQQKEKGTDFAWLMSSLR